MADWSADQYLKFEAERTQPARDLIHRIGVSNPNKIIDIGCGAGNSTEALAASYPGADICGIDSSPDMIEKAASAYPHLKFILCDANNDMAHLGGGYDIVFSNACLQWLPNHGELLKRLFSMLGEAGALAVQMPLNLSEPLYVIIDETARDERFGLSNAKLETNETLSPGEYFDILAGLSRDFDIWETTYYHRMRSHSSLVDWIKGARLRPYLNALPPELRTSFEGEILKRAEEAYKPQANGEIVFKFKRLFFVSRRVKQLF